PCDNCTLHLVTSLPWAAPKVPLDMASLAIVRPAPRPKARDCACLRPLDTDKNPTRTLSGCRNGVYCERGCVRYSLCDSRPLPDSSVHWPTPELGWSTGAAFLTSLSCCRGARRPVSCAFIAAASRPSTRDPS